MTNSPLTGPVKSEKHTLQCRQLFDFLSLDVSVMLHCCLLFLYYYDVEIKCQVDATEVFIADLQPSAT